MARKRLVVEGWRHLAHSYALVAQSHCLSLLTRQDVDLRFHDLPLFSPEWQRTPGIFAAEQEAALAGIAAPEPHFDPNATFTLRPERPDLTAPAAGQRFAFVTAEFRVLLEERRAGLRSGSEVPSTVSVITPSHWSALGLTRFGLPIERIHVIPHGIDPALYRPDEGLRRAMRERLGVGEDFLFVSAGAMTWNKGLDLLLAAFGRVLETHPSARLLLKGADALYKSKANVAEVMNDLPAHTRENIARRLIYIGGTLPSGKMADLLRAADCYVSPYRAEGFNMPVLEANACGVFTVATARGPTDEFTNAEYGARIMSTIGTQPLSSSETGDVLIPDVDHLTELMRAAAVDPYATRALGALSSQHAHRHFTWDQVTNLLVAAMFGVGAQQGDAL